MKIVSRDKCSELGRRAYFGLVALRFLMVFVSTGYLYPDEFFQSPEVMAKDVFNFKATIPWEFADIENPCRSVIPAIITSGIPFYLLKISNSLLTTIGLSSGIESNLLLMLPRLQMCVLSFSIDFVCYSLCKKCKITWTDVLLPFASSWTTLVFLNRTFLNSLEAILVAIAVYQTFGIIKTTDRAKRYKQCLLLGLTISLGIFTRFTFAFFYCSIGLLFLYNVWILDWFANSPVQRLKNIVRLTLMPILIGFLMSSGLFIIIDSIYFSQDNSFAFNKIKIAPFNSFLYNLDSSNLAQHGIHNRWNHAVINMPLMFGPMYFIFLCKFPKYIKRRLAFATKMKLREEVTKRHRKQDHLIRDAMFACVATSLFCLSMAPHQEPRFLLPLAMPLAILAGRFFNKQNQVKRSLLLAFAVFNTGLLLFYGFVHQGGMINSMKYVEEQVKDLQMRSPLVIFYHTYMPPIHLFRIPSNDNIDIADLKGAEVAELNKVLVSNKDRDVWLVAPATVSLESLATDFHLVSSFWPHFTGEDLPSGTQLSSFRNFINSFALNVWSNKGVK